MRKLVNGAFALMAIVAGASCRSAATPPAEAAAPVKVAPAERGAIAEWVTLFGRVVPPPDADATLAPQVPGVLLAVNVRDGDAVRAGDVVARVDGASLRDTLLAAEAAERRAASEVVYRRRAAERTRSLFEKGVASRQEAEADEAAAAAGDAALTEAASGLATARRRAEWADLRAPFDGVVVKVLRRAGDTVDGSPATAVVEIAAPRPVQVAADATAETLVRLAPGQRAEVAFGGGRAGAWKARVVRAARSVDSATGSGEVRLAMEDKDAALVLGASVSLRIAVREKADALTVPAASLRHGPEGTDEVVIAALGKAAVRTVVRGLTDGDRVEIASGLETGDRVVVDDPVGLTDGAAVRVQP
jgi:RND family efflux transporter MFP subunit